MCQPLPLIQRHLKICWGCILSHGPGFWWRQWAIWALVSTPRVLHLLQAFRQMAKPPVPTHWAHQPRQFSMHLTPSLFVLLFPQFVSKSAVGNDFKSCTEVQIYCVHCSLLVLVASHFIIGCSQVGQVWFVLHKSTPAILDCLLVLYRSLSNRASSTFFLCLAVSVAADWIFLVCWTVVKYLLNSDNHKKTTG